MKNLTMVALLAIASGTVACKSNEVYEISDSQRVTTMNVTGMT